MAGLQVNPMQLDFRAIIGVDAPVTLTLFNPHPVERVAFKVGDCCGRRLSPPPTTCACSPAAL